MADLRRLDIDAQVLLRLFLSDVLIEVFGAQGIFSLSVVGRYLVCVDDSVFVSMILFSKSKSSEKCVLLIYCLPICLSVMAISCSTGSELSNAASTGDTSAGV